MRFLPGVPLSDRDGVEALLVVRPRSAGSDFSPARQMTRSARCLSNNSALRRTCWSGCNRDSWRDLFKACLIECRPSSMQLAYAFVWLIDRACQLFTKPALVEGAIVFHDGLR